MRYDEDIKPITYMKTNSADLISEIQKTKRPVIITQNGEAKAVVQDLEAYQQQKNLIMLLKAIALGESEIKRGDLIVQDRLFAKLEKKLNSA